MASSDPYRFMAIMYPMKLFIGEPATFKPEMDFEEASWRVVWRYPEWRQRCTWWLCRDSIMSELIDEETAYWYSRKFNLLTGTFNPFFAAIPFRKSANFDQHK